LSNPFSLYILFQRTSYALFRNFKLFELTEQMRSKRDRVHSEFALSLRDMKSTKPITPQFVENVLKELTPSEIANDPKRWFGAKLLTPGSKC